MIDDKLELALNEQLNRELYSSYLYLAMSAHFDSDDLPGFAAWMRAQADEERAHAMRFFDFVLSRGGRVRLAQVDQPPADYGSPLEVFEQALEHERAITASIDALYEVGDNATLPFLQWFASEQVEEEQTVERIVGSLRMAGEGGPALLMLDRELGARRSDPGEG